MKSSFQGTAKDSVRNIAWLPMKAKIISVIKRSTRMTMDAVAAGNIIRRPSK